MKIEVSEENEWCAVFRKDGEQRVEIIKEVAKRARRTVDYNDVEFDRVRDRDCVGLKGG